MDAVGDRQTWLREQSRRLRQTDGLAPDIAGDLVADELLAIARAEQRQARRLVRLVLSELLLLLARPGGGGPRRGLVCAARMDLEELLDGSASLRLLVEAELPLIYDQAVRIFLTGSAAGGFDPPIRCPFDLDMVLDWRFYP